MAGGRAIGAGAKGATEAFVVAADAEHAQRLVSLLRACPIRGESEEVFEVYTVGHH
jgi:hypothetical protein